MVVSCANAICLGVGPGIRAWLRRLLLNLIGERKELDSVSSGTRLMEQVSKVILWHLARMLKESEVRLVRRKMSRPGCVNA